MLLPIICALAFLAFMTGLALYVERRKKSHQETLAMEVAKSSTEGHMAMLRTFISKVNDGASAIIHNFDWTTLEDYLTNSLTEEFKGTLSILHQDCTIPIAGNPSCTTIYGIETPQGVILLYGSSTKGMYKGLKQKLPFFKFQNGDIEDYVENNLLSYHYEMKVAIPASMSQDNPTYLRIVELLKLARIEHQSDELTDIEHNAKFFNLIKGSHGSYSLREQYRLIKPITKRMLSESYNDVVWTYEGEDMTIPMGLASKIALSCMEHKENISIFGLAGSGKSYLADEFARQASNKQLAVIFVPPSMVPDLQKVELLPDLIRELEQLREDRGLTPVFFIDEAEKLLQESEDGVHSTNNSFMLSLLDGQIQKTLNCSCVLTFNCKIEMLNKAAFRDMRMGMMIQLNELSPEKAAVLVESLKEANPLMIFDEGRWNKIKTKQNLVLANIYKCFIAPTKQRIITNIIRELRGEGPVVDKVPLKTPTRPPTVPVRQAFAPPVRSASADIEFEEVPSGVSTSAPQQQAPHGGNKKNRHKNRNKSNR